MNKLDWCFKQKKGIEIIEKKEHLSKAYIDDAEESLVVFLNVKGKWKIISGYYACYNSLYSILMKCGIKSEIHDCTLELMSLFDFSEQEIDFMKKFKDKRIQTQYYLKENDIDENDVKGFVLKCKEILISLTSKKIEEIRGKYG